MEWIFLSLGIVCLILWVIFNIRLSKSIGLDRYDTSGILMALVMCFVVMFVGLLIEKQASIASLKGNNPYRIEIREEYRDGKFYDSDTVYVKIKNK